VRERSRIIQDATKVGPEHDAGRQQLKIKLPKWQTDGKVAADAMGTAVGDLTQKLTDDGAAAEDDASNNAGLATLLLFVTLLVSAAVAIVILRHLIFSLRRVRVRALEVADDELPHAVQRIRSGEQVSTEIEPLGVGTNEDIGQLSAAFDRVHGEAVRLASEQAGLRADYDDVFINLSRRSQTLVQRQLRLIEQLERDEEDPDQLSTLFQMDHLATRMRRNNENLMLLSGAELGRRFAQTLPIADLMRAAISEIERYQRVQLQQPAAVSVVGYAASDLVRLVAELLDNATNFSAPETKVFVASERTVGGDLLIEITDQGIGMTDDDLAQINEQLRVQNPEEVPVARRMGLFVVGRLAATHRIGVALQRGEERGLRVQVLVPRSLVESAPERPEDTGFDAVPETPLPVRRPGLAARRAGIPTTGGDTEAPAEPSQPSASADSADVAGSHAAGAGIAGAGLAGAAALGGADLFRPTNEQEDDITATDNPVAEHAPETETTAVAEPAETTQWTGFSSLNRRAELEDEASPEHTAGPYAGARDDIEETQLFGADAFPADSEQPYADGLRTEQGTADEFTADEFTAGQGTDGQYTQPEESRPAPNGHAYPDFEAPAAEEPSAPVSNGWFVESGEEQDDTDGGDVFWGTANASWQRPVDEPEDEPEAFTAMGLPKRVPRKNLLPGSASQSTESPKGTAPEHDPDEVKDRFASYRSGVSAARREVESPSDATLDGDVGAHRNGSTPPEEPTPPAPTPSTAAPTHSVPADTESPLGLFTHDAESHSLFTHGDETPGHGVDAPAADGEGGGLFTPGAEPGAAIDWPAEDPEPEAAEPQYTSVGLPRRKPRSTRPAPRPRGEALPPRDSQRVKERMASLQRGLTMGTQRSEPVNPEDHVDRQENE
jgi:signal transduction histidine kinase